METAQQGIFASIKQNKLSWEFDQSCFSPHLLKVIVQNKLITYNKEFRCF